MRKVLSVKKACTQSSLFAFDVTLKNQYKLYQISNGEKGIKLLSVLI